MKIEKKDVTKIIFWKRNPQSISKIIKTIILKEDNVFYLETQNQRIIFSDEKINYLFDKLNNELDSGDIEEYRAMKYENNENDYVLKFYLEIDFSNFTYLAIKGINPMHQKHYKEICEIFDQINAQ